MYCYSFKLAFAALWLQMFVNSASCSSSQPQACTCRTSETCYPLECKSDLATSRPSSHDESSGSGSETLQYALDVEQKENYIAVSLKIVGSWHYSVPGPAGYMLEVFEEGKAETRIGQFANPHSRSGAKTCGSNKEVIMSKSPCDPTVLDLPRTYQWNAHEDAEHPICFRATIQSSDDQSCETLLECRSLNLSSVIVEQEPTESVPKLTVINSPPDPERVAKCERKHNCTEAKLRDFCCDNGKTYESRCHKRIDECIYSQQYKCKKGVCTETESTTEPTNEPGSCEVYRQLNYSYGWKVMCNCDGYYKPIQCFEDTCVCVQENGTQIGKGVKFEGSANLNLTCF